MSRALVITHCGRISSVVGGGVLQAYMDAYSELAAV